MTASENNGQMIVRPTGGAEKSVSRGFGTTDMVARDTAAVAVAERAKAEVQARYIVALQRPRDVDEARVRILDHCKRRRFAEAARYAKPIGNKAVEGPSIRFVEAALQEYGNIVAECRVTYDDDHERRVTVSVTDLERNICYPREIVVRKIVERRFLKQDQVAIGQRTNSYGDQVYLVEATEDDLLIKQAAAESKALRTLGLRVLPADIVDEAMDQCVATVRANAESDPAAARRKLIDAFHSVGVSPRHLVEYLGHELEQTSPAELADLRACYQTLRDGETTWAHVLAARLGDAPAAPATEKPAKGSKAVKEQLAKRRKAPEAATEAAAEPAVELEGDAAMQHFARLEEMIAGAESVDEVSTVCAAGKSLPDDMRVELAKRGDAKRAELARV